MQEQKKLNLIKYFSIAFIAFMILLALILFFNQPENQVVYEEDKLSLYFFYGDGCPHCAKEEEFLDKLEKRYAENLKVFRFETWYNTENADLLARLSRELDIEIKGVPVTIIGQDHVIGYYSEEITGVKIEEMVTNNLTEECIDSVAPILIESDYGHKCPHNCDQDGGTCEHECGCSAGSEPETETESDLVSLPFIGEVSARTLSLPFLTFIIAATDGFNPCAMWVLLFLISLLLGMKDRKRTWILGLAFIGASGAVYFMFLSAWLNLIMFLSFVFWLRLLIGVVALSSGAYHLYDAYKNRDGGCHVVGTEKRQKTFQKIRKIVEHKSFFLAVVGIALLAVAVNMVELVCSAGLPAVYTQVLTMSDLPMWQYYTYLLFYILVFMLDDLLIFFIAMTTLQMKAISSKYTVWAQWVGGIVMLLLGILLIFKPELIMFG